MNTRLGLLIAILLPFAACGVQLLLWDAYIEPYVWFLFFPAAFFSARFGGLRGGLAGTLVSALLVWYFFIPPRYSFALQSNASLASIILFMIMGGLFAWLFESLQQALRRTEQARAQAEAANRDITRLYLKTLELDQLKSRFFANVSHELRTPLTLIMAPLEKRLADQVLAAAERTEDEMMLRNARILYRQVADLLDTAKLEAGAMRAEYQHLDLAELARSMASHFDSMARERGIAYGVDAPPALPAEADAEKVRRILLNLLSNAFKFTPDGGRIAVRLGVEPDLAVIEVQDNGPGVPAGMSETVFEAFRQVEGAANRRHGGTGLGLAIVREFAQLHGGGAAVAMAPGGGALFTVRLPLAAPAGTPVLEAAPGLDPINGCQDIEEPAAPEPDDSQAPLVLVVEDNPDMNAFIARCLRQRYRVASAFDGRAGLEKAQALAPDLILADVMMPVLSGDEMVLELRRMPGLADVPIVMLTARADDELRVRMLKAGVQDCLDKPFTVCELLARVDGLLNERRRIYEQLKDSETRFVATFEQAAVGIALVAADGRWLRVNRKLCAIVGYMPAELLLKSFQDITFPADLQADLEQMRRMLAREIDTYSLEKRYIRKDGGLVWVNLSATLVRKPDGAADYFIRVVEDISARKEAEAQLKPWREVFEKAEFGLAIGNPQGQTISSVNPAFARRRGYAPEELQGKSIKMLFPPDRLEEVLAQVRAVDEQGHGSFETEHLCKNGERFPVLLDITVFKAADTKHLSRIVFALDISERKQAELALRRRSDELRERNRELERFELASVGRELEMIRLKRQVNALSRELGRAPPFELSFADADWPPSGEEP